MQISQNGAHANELPEAFTGNEPLGHLVHEESFDATHSWQET